MPQINIIGASGTGKTTLATGLAKTLACPHFDSDDYFHLPTEPPFQAQRSPDDRLRMLVSDLGPYTDWVFSGSVIGWGSHPRLSFSLIVFLYLEPEIRLDRLRQREQTRFGKRLAPGGDMHQDHLDFMEWTADYDSGRAAINNIKLHSDWLDRQSCTVLRLSEPLSTEAQIEGILAVL
ncbi:MAG: AAA family ATPase [Candidatus Sericytochromatia bacterium]